MKLMDKNKSTHILNTSSNLLGFCLVVLTSLKISKISETTMIDECTGVTSILLMGSSLLSFLAIRSKKERHGESYEKIADVIFLVALVLIFLITFLVAFTVAF